LRPLQWFTFSKAAIIKRLDPLKKRPVSRMRTRVMFTLGLMVGVAACAAPPKKSVMGNYVPLTSTATPAATEPVAKPEPAKTTAPVTPLPAKAVPTRSVQVKSVEVKPEPVIQIARKPAAEIQKPKPTPIAPPPPLLTSNDVLGLGPTKVTGLLGEPKMVRREKPAEVWQYAGADCVLHVFLYDDEPSGTFRVDHLEATDLQGGKAPTDTCLAGLVSK
jgi:hypothetical protein